MRKMTVILIVALSCLTTVVGAQDKVEPILNADLVSQFIWRGLDRGDVSIQPELGISWKGFSLSAWGSIGLSNSKDCKEIDLKASYTIGGLTLTLSDYWTDETNLSYFDYHARDTGHVFEGGVGYDFGVLSLSWQTIFAGNNFQKQSGKRAYSSYAEVVVPFNLATCEWEATIGVVPYASDYYLAKGFRVSNLSLRATKDIPITQKFALPVFAQLVGNPNTKKLFFVFGISIGR